MMTAPGGDVLHPAAGSGGTEGDPATLVGLVGPSTRPFSARSIVNTRPSRSSTRSAANSPRRNPPSAANRTNNTSCSARNNRSTAPGEAGRSSAAAWALSRRCSAVVINCATSSGRRCLRGYGRGGDFIPTNGSASSSRSATPQLIAACNTRNRPEIITTVAPSCAHRANADCTIDGVNVSTQHRLNGSRRTARAICACDTIVVGLHPCTAPTNRSNNIPTVQRSPVHTGMIRRTPNRSTNCACRSRTTPSLPRTVNERCTLRPAGFTPTVTRTSHTPG